MNVGLDDADVCRTRTGGRPLDTHEGFCAGR